MVWVAGGLLLLAAILIGLGVAQVNKGINASPEVRPLGEEKPKLTEVFFAYFKKMIGIIMDPKEPRWRKQIAWGVALITLGLTVLVIALVPTIQAIAAALTEGGGGGDGAPTTDS